MPARSPARNGPQKWPSSAVPNRAPDWADRQRGVPRSTGRNCTANIRWLPGSRPDEMTRRCLDESLSTRGDSELSARVFEMKLDRALAQTQDFADFPEC